MKKEVNPRETSRAQAYELWMKAPNPMGEHWFHTEEQMLFLDNWIKT